MYFNFVLGSAAAVIFLLLLQLPGRCHRVQWAPYPNVFIHVGPMVPLLIPLLCLPPSKYPTFPILPCDFCSFTIYFSPLISPLPLSPCLGIATCFIFALIQCYLAAFLQNNSIHRPSLVLLHNAGLILPCPG